MLGYRGDWLSTFKRLGSACRQIRRHVYLRRYDEAPFRCEVVDAMLPGKASKVS